MTQSPRASADVPAGASFGMQMNKRLQGAGHYEPSLQAVRIPRCTNCMSANPGQLSVCPCCGIAAPGLTDHRNVEAVLTGELFPWHARLLLWIGAQLRNLANRLSGS